MTTTVPTHGGAAVPASIVTDGKTMGRVATRVYGFTSAAEAAAAGYKCEAGPASSVYVVSAAELASGKFIAEGDPKALPMYAAPAGMKVEAGYAQPIVIVGGGLSVAGGGSILPLTIDFSTLPDGALPSPLTGATWAISGGRAVNTPTGATLASGFGGTYAGSGTLSFAPGWENVGMDDGSDVASEETTIKHGSTSSQKIVVDANSEGIQSSANFNVSKNRWAIISFWERVGVNLDATLVSNYQGNWPSLLLGNYITPSTTAWTQYVRSLRALNDGTERLRLRSAFYDHAGGTYYFGDLTILNADQNTLFSTVDTKQSAITVKASLTIGNLQQINAACGVVCNLDNEATPQNFVVCWIDNANKLYLEKCVGGTYTTLINAAAITYGAGRLIEIRRLAGTNTYQAWYNGAQVGTDQTVSDAEIISNTRAGLFGTGGGNSVSACFFLAAV